MPDSDFKRVNYDKGLHKYANKHWHYWYHSKEHAIAFQKYYRQGSVPHRKYPAPLVIHHKKTGTVSFEQLEGTHDWRNQKWQHEFQASGIYNRKLSEWVSNSRSGGNKTASLSLKKFKYNIPRIVTLLCVIFTLMYLMNSWGIMHTIPEIALLIIFVIGAISSFWSMAKYDGILMKILYAIYGGICAFICLCSIGVIPIQVGFVMAIIIPLIIFLIVFFVLGMVVVFIRFLVPSMGIGGGLVFGGVSGWHLANKLFGKK